MKIFYCLIIIFIIIYLKVLLINGNLFECTEPEACLSSVCYKSELAVLGICNYATCCQRGSVIDYSSKVLKCTRCKLINLYNNNLK